MKDANEAAIEELLAVAIKYGETGDRAFLYQLQELAFNLNAAGLLANFSVAVATWARENRLSMNEARQEFSQHYKIIIQRPATQEHSRSLDRSKLAKDLDAILPGNEGANDFHELILTALTAIFFPRLKFARKELPLSDGRKRVDIVFSNEADLGFFHNLSCLHGVRCGHVYVECKNYANDPTNPEFDQLTGRFSKARGQFGILVCRSVKDWKLMISRCRDVINDDRGNVIVLDDVDIKRLLQLSKDGYCSDVDEFFSRKFSETVM